MVSCPACFFPVELGVWGLISMSAAWMMRRLRLPWNRERTSPSVQPCAGSAACHSPMLPLKSAQENPEVSFHALPLYQAICSCKEELRWAVPDFSPCWASCTMLNSSTTINPLSSDTAQTGQALRLRLRFAVYRQFFQYVLGDFMLCVVYCNLLYIPFLTEASKKQTSYLKIINSFGATGDLKWPQRQRQVTKTRPNLEHINAEFAGNFVRARIRGTGCKNFLEAQLSQKMEPIELFLISNQAPFIHLNYKHQ